MRRITNYFVVFFVGFVLGVGVAFVGYKKRVTLMSKIFSMKRAFVTSYGRVKTRGGVTKGEVK